MDDKEKNEDVSSQVGDSAGLNKKRSRSKEVSNNEGERNENKTEKVNTTDEKNIEEFNVQKAKRMRILNEGSPDVQVKDTIMTDVAPDSFSDEKKIDPESSGQDSTSSSTLNEVLPSQSHNAHCTLNKTASPPPLGSLQGPTNVLLQNTVRRQNRIIQMGLGLQGTASPEPVFPQKFAVYSHYSKESLPAKKSLNEKFPQEDSNKDKPRLSTSSEVQNKTEKNENNTSNHSVVTDEIKSNETTVLDINGRNKVSDTSLDMSGCNQVSDTDIGIKGSRVRSSHKLLFSFFLVVILSLSKKNVLRYDVPILSQAFQKKKLTFLRVTKSSESRHLQHLIVFLSHRIPMYWEKKYVDDNDLAPYDLNQSSMSLREFLSHPDGFHLALAPAFFGFYAYLGALTALHENVLTEEDKANGKYLLPIHPFPPNVEGTLLKSVAGASAGAMAAVQIAAGLNPRGAAEFASSMTLGRIADPFGIGGILKGETFQDLMASILNEAEILNGGGLKSARLEHGLVPVAVTGFDLLSMKGKILTSGCMAQAARASATFPGLFQPVVWDDEEKNQTSEKGIFKSLGKLIPPALLIDGGVTDPLGLLGLSAILPDKEKRIVNIIIGSYGKQRPPGPALMPPGLKATEVVSISIENTPKCGPWAMGNGPRAVKAAMEAVLAVLDVPMLIGKEKGHYILRVDASAFCQ